MKIGPAIVGTTILIIAAIFAPSTSSSGVFRKSQEKVTYQRTGSEGTITGKVSFIGEPPQPKRIDGSADPQCEAGNAEELFTKDVIVKAGSCPTLLCTFSPVRRWTGMPLRRPQLRFCSRITDVNSLRA